MAVCTIILEVYHHFYQRPQVSEAQTERSVCNSVFQSEEAAAGLCSVLCSVPPAKHLCRAGPASLGKLEGPWGARSLHPGYNCAVHPPSCVCTTLALALAVPTKGEPQRAGIHWPHVLGTGPISAMHLHPHGPRAA